MDSRRSAAVSHRPVVTGVHAAIEISPGRRLVMRQGRAHLGGDDRNEELREDACEVIVVAVDQVSSRANYAPHNSSFTPFMNCAKSSNQVHWL